MVDVATQSMMMTFVVEQHFCSQSDSTAEQFPTGGVAYY